MMYNAKQIMAAEGVTERQICVLLSLSPEAVRSRLFGDEAFSVGEAFLLKDVLFPSYTLDALFSAAAQAS